MEGHTDFSVAGAGKSKIKDIEQLMEEIISKIGPLALKARRYLPQIAIVLLTIAMLVALAYYYYYVK
jgi:hypothetical protein